MPATPLGNADNAASANLSPFNPAQSILVPWPHQEEALVQLEQAASESDRMSLVMACGSGKIY